MARLGGAWILLGRAEIFWEIFIHAGVSAMDITKDEGPKNEDRAVRLAGVCRATIGRIMKGY